MSEVNVPALFVPPSPTDAPPVPAQVPVPAEVPVPTEVPHVLTGLPPSPTDAPPVPAEAPPSPAAVAPALESPAEEAALTGEELVREVCENAGPVRYQALTVRGPLALRSRDFSHRLELRDVVFEDLVDLRDSHFRKTVDLRGCTFRAGLRMEGTRVDGTLLMSRVAVHPLAGDNRGRGARLSLLKVGGHLLARGLVVQGGVDLTRARVRGHLDLASRPERRTHLGGALVMNVARVGGDVRLSGALVQGDLQAEAVRVRAYFSAGPLRENPELDEGPVREITHIHGEANLSGARITGELSFSAARVEKELNLQAAEVRGGVFCRTVLGRQPVIGGDLSAPAARVMATLDLSGAQILGDVFMDGATVQGTMFMLNGWISRDGAPPSADGSAPPAAAPREPDLRTRVRGKLGLSHVVVGGDVQIRDAWLEKGATLADATVSGAVSLSQSTVAGGVNLEAARIAGGFYCRCIDGVPPTIDGSIEGKAAQIGAGIFLSGAVWPGTSTLPRPAWRGRWKRTPAACRRWRRTATMIRAAPGPRRPPRPAREPWCGAG